MDILRNIGGAMGISHGNILKSALKMIGLPDGLAAGIGAVVDLKNGNFGSLLFRTGPEALKALTGGAAGQANSVERPSNILGTLAKVAGFAALGVGGAALLGGGGATAAMTALAGLTTGSKAMLGIAAMLGFGAVAGGGGSALSSVFGFQSQDARQSIGATRTRGGPDSLVSRLPNPCTFEDLVAAFMVDFVKDKQKEIEGKLDKLRKSAENAEGSGVEGGARGFFGGLLSSIPIVGQFFGNANNANKASSSESRNIEFEMLKNEMQKLSQMQQAMSNVLNEMHNLAMSAIRGIKG